MADWHLIAIVGASWDGTKKTGIFKQIGFKG